MNLERDLCCSWELFVAVGSWEQNVASERDTCCSWRYFGTEPFVETGLWKHRINHLRWKIYRTVSKKWVCDFSKPLSAKRPMMGRPAFACPVQVQKLGWQLGDRIIELNGKEIDEWDDFKQAFELWPWPDFSLIDGPSFTLWSFGRQLENRPRMSPVAPARLGWVWPGVGLREAVRCWRSRLRPRPRGGRGPFGGFCSGRPCRALALGGAWGRG